ncbi:hypothetical protein B9Z55_002210 [Caenorhabditis nigoni]|uniref:Uncharacterized protein n=1 Tax=Caenorhabditis nigoni TaxID=1611254 RepID=A0A2G5VJE3_9PELO|nr:hypothetical protein B9Z55_002210 [Caenorhabditis nigoni]
MVAPINIMGLMFSIYFYTWLHPDLSKNVRIGLNQFKVDCMIYVGTIIWLFVSMCIVAPYFTRRTNALAGNVGMAISSLGVILSHYLLENKWVWSGLMYICDIQLYAFSLGLALMGQWSIYHYDKNRAMYVAFPVVCNTIVVFMLYSVLETKGFNDVLPLSSFGVHTAFAILAQVAAPRLKTWNFFEYINKNKRR